MLSDDVLRSLRYLLDLPDAHLVKLAAPFSEQVEADLFEAYLKKEDRDGFQTCPDRYLTCCLGGLIIQRRGRGKPRPLPSLELPLSNNMILKRLWIALGLKEEDPHATPASVNFPVSKPELSALFRKLGHSNYRTCSNQLPRSFLEGLTLYIHG